MRIPPMFPTEPNTVFDPETALFYAFLAYWARLGCSPCSPPNSK